MAKPLLQLLLGLINSYRVLGRVSREENLNIITLVKIAIVTNITNKRST